MTTFNASRGTFWRRFAPLLGVGVVGVVAIAPVMATRLAALPGVPQESLPLVVGAALAQSILLVAGAIATGVALAPRLGLRSHLADKGASGAPLLPALRSELPLAVGSGAVGAVIMLAGDVVFRALMPEAAAALAAALPHNTLIMTLGGMLYGGIVEELLMRWGLMTLLARIGWHLTSRLAQRDTGAPSKAVMWTAITLAALVIGAGHLPVTATIVSLTPVVILRTLVLNSIGGMLFGWLYWRHSLEAGMMAHATFHVVATIVAILAPMLSGA